MMLSTGRSSNSSSSSRYPFTPTQWQELEHQALIYKYMASGIPVPSDLLLPIRRSFLFSSAAAATGIPPYYSQPGMGWSCFQMGGYGRKAEDPEPGRCRRTDGKKWRCSKEAYPDSKYCERHMHRGKNRSRKPVEVSLNNNNNSPSSSSSTATTYSSVSSSSSSLNPSLPLSISAPDSSYYPYQLHQYPLHHPYNSSSSDNRFCHGMKDVDEYSFLSDASAGCRGGPWELRPLGLGEPKQSAVYSKGEEDEERRKKHCFVLGADFKLGKTDKERQEEESQRPLRHFFDEWPQKSNRESWIGLEGESSKTQLSISIPMGLHDFPQ